MVKIKIMKKILIIAIILIGCQKVDIEPKVNILFRIESSSRFFAAYGVNNNLIDKYVYTTNFVSGVFTVAKNDTLYLSAYPDSLDYEFTILCDGEEWIKNNSSIYIVF